MPVSNNARVRIDPRVKLVLFVVTCLSVISCTNVVLNLICGTYIAVLLFLSGKEWYALKSWLLFAAGLFLAPLLRGRIEGAWSVLFMALSVLLRIMLPIFMAFRLVFSTTTVSQFIASFQKMKLPVKVIIPVAVMFRFVPTVWEEWSDIRKAMAFRGISFNVIGILKHPFYAVECMLVPLLFGATSIMDELAAASLARGLDSDRKRSCLEEVKFSLPDYLFFVVTIGLFVLMKVYR